jgi:flagellar export protein FliJ
MSRFKFRLQSVLDHTGRQKQQAAADFAAATLELEARQAELAAHCSVFVGLKTAAPEPKRGLRAARLHERQACRDRVTWQIHGAKQRVEEQAELTGKRRNVLVESQRAEKKYLLLKDRHLTAWQTETRRKEQRELDEIAGRRAAFQKQSRRA